MIFLFKNYIQLLKSNTTYLDNSLYIFAEIARLSSDFIVSNKLNKTKYQTAGQILVCKCFRYESAWGG